MKLLMGSGRVCRLAEDLHAGGVEPGFFDRLAQGGDVGDGFAGGFGERVVFGVDFAAGEGGLTGV